MTRDVPRCPRCLDFHPALAFVPLEHPIIGYREHAACPNGKGPILAAPSLSLANVIRTLGRAAKEGAAEREAARLDALEHLGRA